MSLTRGAFSAPAARKGRTHQVLRQGSPIAEHSPSPMAVRPFLIDYFGRHGYELIEEYLEYDAFNWYFRPSLN